MFGRQKQREERDEVDKLMADCSAKSMVDWMVNYHGLPEHSRSVVTTNLEEQFRWQRLRGRLDRSSLWATVIEMWLRLKA